MEKWEEQEKVTNFIKVLSYFNGYIKFYLGGKQRHERNIGAMGLSDRVEGPFVILNKENRVNSIPNTSDLLCIQQSHFHGLTYLMLLEGEGCFQY